MGKLEGGIFGNLRGKIGNHVYYAYRGKTVARTVGKITKPPTVKQLTCRQRLKVLSTFFKPMKAFINLGFAQAIKGTDMSAYNAAIQYGTIGLLRASTRM